MTTTTEKFTAFVGSDYIEKNKKCYYLHDDEGEKIPIVLRDDLLLVWRPPRTDDYDFGSTYQVIHLQNNKGKTSLTIQKTIPIRDEL
tara:strand:- start:536 stop:796 length:261 start_codon:yes stop_codon:yes gene_type:complete